MIPKVLVWVDDGRITVLHTPGVEVAVVIEGEDVTVPDDWVGLTAKQEHSLPITVNRAELPQKRPLACDSTGLVGTKTPEHDHSGLMKAPYCPDCDGNHSLAIGCDGLPKTCSCCGASYGQLHSTGCADQNALVEGGNIVQ